MSTKTANTAAKTNTVATAPAKHSLQRQCACGNHTAAGGECASCAAKKLQKKLSIGATNDPLELEADRVADQVLAYQPAHSFSTISAPKIQRRAEQSSQQTEEVPASVERVLASSGNPLPIAARKDMEQRFGQDFSHVRMHTGSAAEQSANDVNANAYTVGNNIVFNRGKFSPETNSGKHLLAHELTHVVQQHASSDETLQRDIDQLELEKCMARRGDNTKPRRKDVIVDRDGGIATDKDLELYEKLCTAEQVERQSLKQSKLDDLLLAVVFSVDLIPGAVKKHAGEMAEGLIEGLIEFAKDAAKILAASTAIGALIGAIVGAGAGAVPGAEIGFEIGLKILELYGLAMLIHTIIGMAGGFISNLGQFLNLVFQANGDKDQLKKAANNLAEAIGILVSALLLALLAYLLKKGTEKILQTKFAKTVGESRLAKWFKERANSETSKEIIKPSLPGPSEHFLFGSGKAPPPIPETPNKLYRIMGMEEAAVALKTGKLPSGMEGTMGSKFLSLDSKYSILFREKILAKISKMGEGIAKAEANLTEVEGRLAEVEVKGDQVAAAKLRANAEKLRANITKRSAANKATTDPMLKDWFEEPGQKVVVEIEVEAGTIENVLNRAVDENLINLYRGKDVYIWKFERGYGRNIAIPPWQLDSFNTQIKAIRFYAERGLKLVGPKKIPPEIN